MSPIPIAIVQGSSKGIGLGIARYLLRHDPELIVIATSRTPKETEKSILENEDKAISERLRVLEMDVTKEDQIHSAREKVESEFGKGNIKALFNLYPEKTITKVSYDTLLETFKINTFGPLLMVKHFLPLIPRNSVPPTKLFPQDFSLVTSFSARVGSIEDNKSGGWYSYRSWKAAQNQITKTLSWELQFCKYKAIAVGYHPGTVETALSGEMGKRRREAGERGVFTVDEAVEKFVHNMRNLEQRDSGKVIDCEGKEIPW